MKTGVTYTLVYKCVNDTTLNVHISFVYKHL